jgi:hypothetical protein
MESHEERAVADEYVCQEQQPGNEPPMLPQPSRRGYGIAWR